MEEWTQHMYHAQFSSRICDVECVMEERKSRRRGSLLYSSLVGGPEHATFSVTILKCRPEDQQARVVLIGF